ncbi:ABC transporter permease [Oryzihumus sp.]|uniref:ABC transporter permease n=1 Tax=Oryzihumus sp. TaxID=1968903 RepID=UPI002ED8285B
MSWLSDHFSEVMDLTVHHIYLAGVPLLIGLALALPFGWLARRYRFLYPPLIIGTGLLYTIPSLSLFVLMPLLVGTQILDPVNVIIALTIYTLALLVRTVADGLGAVPDDVNQAATAMGYTRGRRFFAVELPLAVPVIAAGLRVAAVSNVSIVSVAALLGIPQLGQLFLDGYQRFFYDPIIVGLIACILLALAFDLVIVAIARLLTPWVRARQGA